MEDYEGLPEDNEGLLENNGGLLEDNKGNGRKIGSQLGINFLGQKTR